LRQATSMWFKKSHEHDILSLRERKTMSKQAQLSNKPATSACCTLAAVLTYDDKHEVRLPRSPSQTGFRSSEKPRLSSHCCHVYFALPSRFFPRLSLRFLHPTLNVWFDDKRSNFSTHLIVYACGFTSLEGGRWSTPRGSAVQALRAFPPMYRRPSKSSGQNHHIFQTIREQNQTWQKI